MKMAKGFTSYLLILLQLYFLMMNFTVERYYCDSKGIVKEDDTRFLMKETLDFCNLNNPLFLAHPEWMVIATCFSAYVFPLGYITVLVAACFDLWRLLAVPLLLFLGAKFYGIFFYHIMEFSNQEGMAPKNLVPYFLVEGPYILSMLIVLKKVVYAINSGKEKSS